MSIGALPSFNKSYDYYQKSSANQTPINNQLPELDSNPKSNIAPTNGIIDPSSKQINNKDKNNKLNKDSKNNQPEDTECQTCESRSYKDVSDDPGVSFKSATKVSPGIARSAVMGHEQQHVARNKSKADREDREVISSSVTIHSSICNDCGKPYVSGGTTRTVTANKNRYDVGKPEQNKSGQFLDVTA